MKRSSFILVLLLLATQTVFVFSQATVPTSPYYSDDYVLMRLKMMEADRAIDAARQRLDYAASFNAASLFPSEYNRAQTAYGDARAYRLAENWDNAIDAANRVLAALTGLGGR